MIASFGTGAGDNDLSKTSGFAYGVKLTTTASGGPFNNITLNYYKDSDLSVYAEDGVHLYVLTAEYSGRASDLGTGTSGYVTHATTVTSNQWVFPASQELSANTTYYVYMNGESTTSLDGGSLTAETYSLAASGQPYATQTNQQLAFSLEGTVNDAPNAAPAGLVLSVSSVAENETIGTVVGTFSTTDADTGDTHTYTLVSGSGDTDNANFTIDGTSLKTAVSFDYETQSSQMIRVETDDGNGGTLEQIFTISITDDTSDNPQVVSYGWEDDGVHHGKSGNLKSAVNVGAENGVTPRTGAAMLRLRGDSVGGNAPEAYLVWITGLAEGDQVTASFWVSGLVDNNQNSTGRIWGGYTSASRISAGSEGSAGGNETY